MDTMKQIQSKLKMIIKEEGDSDINDTEIMDAERVLSARTNVPLIKEEDIEPVIPHSTPHKELKHLWLQQLLNPLQDIQGNELGSLLYDCIFQYISAYIVL